MGIHVSANKLASHRNFCALILAAIALATLISARSASAQTEAVLHDFISSTGISPYSGVVFDTHGNLFGTTVQGARQDAGVVYEMSPSSGGEWTYTVLHNFAIQTKKDGFYSLSTPIFDGAGNLYGTVVAGGAHNLGGVYEMSPQAGGTWSERLIYNFQGWDGAHAQGSLIFDAAGNLYGTTYEGGTTYASGACKVTDLIKGCGAVYQLKPDGQGGWVEKLLWSFSQNGTDGYNPQSPLTMDAAGNLYGTNLFGGAFNYGIVFELSPTPSGTWTETILHSFNNDGTDGFFAGPGGVIFDAAGNLYGTTGNGGSGANARGTVFEMSPSSSGTWTETILHSFQSNGSDGINPAGWLLFDAAGNLYGTNAEGGTHHNGTVCELSPSTGGLWTETILYDFGLLPDGDGSVAGITFDSAGNLYGTTEYGGSGKNYQCSYLYCGTVFVIMQ